MKNKFLSLLSEIKRPGMDKLVDWLINKSDFFKAPASTQYHGANEGGLLEHSFTVYENLKKINEDYKLNISVESIIICGLFHDICKINFYTVSTRNVKNETTGQWEKQPFYKIDDKFPYGHGEKSVYILNEFIHLTVEEAMAIRWHMGVWGAESYNDRISLSSAMEKYPIILVLQMADQAATYFDKK